MLPLRISQMVQDGNRNSQGPTAKNKIHLSCMRTVRRQPEIHKGQVQMTHKKDYPLHPGQTHADPYYCTIPLEEYEALKKENARMKETLKRHGITLLEEK